MPDVGYWLIIFLPVMAFLFNGLIMRPVFKERNSRWAGYVTIAFIGGAWVLAVWGLASAVNSPGDFHKEISTDWLDIGANFKISIGLLVDKLSIIMVLVVTTCSWMIQIYSQGYMHGDNGYMRYFTWMPLFTAAMLGVALSGNLLFTFICWEMVGLCSYLLIGFWYHKPSAAAAAKKAFVVTRFADLGFVMALVGIWKTAGTFNILALPDEMKLVSSVTFTLILLGLFAGAVGKSAQFPLHTWLPDAMEGPTPVSALIHSSTMVCAGVFLVARLFPLYGSEHGQTASLVVAGIGGFTSIFAASMGIVMYDVKRVLAYSTISQLGYMMLGLGAVAYGASIAHDHIEAEELLALGFAIGMFHLFTHAFFKSMLFLASGSLQHSSGTFDMRLMGGMKKYMPRTFIIFVVGSLSLSGIWPLAGFWSKDGILLLSYEHTPWFFWLAMITVFMTAFYMFRAVFMTFYGEFRGGDPSGLHHGDNDEAHGSAEVHPHESPFVMVGPMLVLMVLAIGSGWSLGKGQFSAAHFLGGHVHGYFGLFTHFGFSAENGLPVIGLLVALFGIFSAWAIYKAEWVSAEAIGAMFKPIRTLWYRKYYMDELYEGVIVRGILMRGIFRVSALFDTYVVDGIVNGAASVSRGLGNLLSKLQSGQLQEYGLAMGAGVLVVVAVFLIGYYMG